MKSDKAVTLMNALMDEGYEAEIRDDYSGRGMYGAETHAVTSEASPATVTHVCGANNLPDPRKDNMGMDYVYY